MGAITRWILKLTDLAEAEGRLFRWHALRLGMALTVMLGGVLLVVGGIACAAAATIVWLSRSIGQVGALFIAALGLLILGGVLAWSARQFAE
ncbi:MAG: hypothetical protein IT442_00385 [Phycisphaeraceae bacterium]|nr:hypothetical protein [Phycisphaeraceae bacterium]